MDKAQIERVFDKMFIEAGRSYDASQHDDFDYSEIHKNAFNEYANSIMGEIDRLTAELAQARAEIEAMRERERWVPVGERLPEKAGTYLWINKRNAIIVQSYDPKIPKAWKKSLFDYYTHWTYFSWPEVESE